MGTASAQIGGKGTVRRKPAKVNKAATLDDKKLQAVLKRHGVSAATGIEEVSIFKTDGSFTYFSAPKRASAGPDPPPHPFPPPPFLLFPRPCSRTLSHALARRRRRRCAYAPPPLLTPPATSWALQSRPTLQPTRTS